MIIVPISDEVLAEVDKLRTFLRTQCPEIEFTDQEKESINEVGFDTTEELGAHRLSIISEAGIRPIIQRSLDSE